MFKHLKLKNRLYCLFTAISISICAFAQTESHQITENDVTNSLINLDEVISKKSEYVTLRQQHTDSLKRVLSHAAPEQLPDLYRELFNNYNHIQTDSALYYLELLENTPQAQNGESVYYYTQIGKAEVYAIRGLYSVSLNILKQIDSNKLDQSTRLMYLHTARSIYGWMADYADIGEMSDSLSRITQLYRDSIIACQPEGIGRNIVIVDKMLVEGKADKALSISFKDLEESDETMKAYIYSNIAQAYKQKGNTKLYTYYLALTATHDIKHGINEYMALPELANTMYHQGDITRAYNYLICSMEDANYCKARLRAVEASDFFPIIDKTYQANERARRQTQTIFTVALGISAAILIVSLLFLRRQMKSLRAIRQELATANKQLAMSNQELEKQAERLEQSNLQLALANSQLTTANSQLTAADQVKEEYIAFYLEKCRSYIDTLEHFRRDTLRLAKNKQHTDLLNTLKSEELITEEQNRFLTDFDTAFLNIHPSFVNDFNKLLRPDKQIIPQRGELLTTELRIFALIRLGVTSTQRIAHFLNYSIATIYNYRSRIRNYAISDKDSFEETVAKL